MPRDHRDYNPTGALRGAVVFLEQEANMGGANERQTIRCHAQRRFAGGVMRCNRLLMLGEGLREATVHVTCPRCKALNRLAWDAAGELAQTLSEPSAVA
jgi:phage FluMu protein Com